ncbi:MAG: DUF2284 domain-containing protein [Clostridiales bacterium]|nr:DUF2284 domain-containing protein [Clostridiales bacterium]
MKTDLLDFALSLGASNASFVAVSDVVFDTSFREACERNACGKYGKFYTCPPDVGAIEDLISRAKEYLQAFVFQTISPLEDSFDIEGMLESGQRHNKLSRDVFAFAKEHIKNALCLSSGGCGGLCENCAKLTSEPCRYPHLASSSLSAYGINVSLLAKAAGMKYNNGVNTVTYFSAIFF